MKKRKNVDEDTQKKNPYRECAVGESTQSVLFCGITSELMYGTPLGQ